MVDTTLNMYKIIGVEHAANAVQDWLTLWIVSQKHQQETRHKTKNT